MDRITGLIIAAAECTPTEKTMRRIYCMMLLQAVQANGKTVTKTFARITNVVISGPAEHTLVITNYYPSYTQHYTATWAVEYYDADVEVPDDDDDDEENEQENGGGDGGDVVFSTSVEWAISGAGAAFAEASAPIIASVPRSAPSGQRAALRGGGSSASSEKDVLFTEGNIEDVHLTLQVHVICTQGDGVGDDHAAEFIIHAPSWEPYTLISAYVGGSGIHETLSIDISKDWAADSRNPKW